MEYKIDITNNYPRFFWLDNEVGIEQFISFDLIQERGNDIEINLENIAVNMDEKCWFLPILEKNPESIISDTVKTFNSESLDNIFTVLLKKAKLKIYNSKCLYAKYISEKKEYYHSDDSNFNIGDKCIWLSGYSADFRNTFIQLRVIFSGEVQIIFDETDILINTIDFESFIDKKCVETLNKTNAMLVDLKNRNFEKIKLNSIKSKFFDFEYLNEYFNDTSEGNIAIKNYSML